jgi:hypothetical protein
MLLVGPSHIFPLKGPLIYIQSEKYLLNAYYMADTVLSTDKENISVLKKEKHYYQGRHEIHSECISTALFL